MDLIIQTGKDYVLAIYKLIVLLDIPDKLAKKEQALLDAGDQTASKEYGQEGSIQIKALSEERLLHLRQKGRAYDF